MKSSESPFTLLSRRLSQKAITSYHVISYCIVSCCIVYADTFRLAFQLEKDIEIHSRKHVVHDLRFDMI